MNCSEILYDKFCATKQEKQKLLIALEEILCQETINEKAKKEYLAYLQLRHRATCSFVEELQKNEFIWNLSISDLWERVRWNLMRKYPYFSSAFTSLTPRRGFEQAIGCDGNFLYTSSKWEVKQQEEALPSLCRLYFHMVLHCFFGHMVQGEGRDKRCWDLACDLCVEAFMLEEFPELFSLSLQEQVKKEVLGEEVRSQEKKRKEVIATIKKEVKVFHADPVYAYLKQSSEWETWEPLFHRDCHSYWSVYDYEENQKSEKLLERNDVLQQMVKRSQERLSLVEKWKTIRRQIRSEKGNTDGKRGIMAGRESYEMSLKKQKKYDYRRFLKRFTFPGEEMQLDFDSFDYLPYTYSRAHYEKLVFLEPLEYTQVHKLKELVIAIDTSGSCRGKVVQQFLEETYQILSRQEHFFKKMRVYLIQCDSMIQDCICIENQEQWQEYVKNLKIQGLGGTDFRPVFAWIEHLREEKVLGKPGGLIYFTDGDGIYPRKAPDYETAFVFLNDTYKKGSIPSWAVELNLQIAIEE